MNELLFSARVAEKVEVVAGTIGHERDHSEFAKPRSDANTPTPRSTRASTILLNQLLDSFTGKLTSSKWVKMERRSPHTVPRDMTDLLSRGIPSKGRMLASGAQLPAGELSD